MEYNESVEGDYGMITLEDRYAHRTQYETATLEDELAWYEIEERSCSCPRLGMFGQYHHDYCARFEDNSN